MRQVTVLASGSFDPLHKGHIFYLGEAKKLGDKLIVIVTSDKKIAKYKGRQPRESQQERARQVEELRLADEVIIGESDSFTLAEKLKPDIIALGYDQKVPEPLKNKVKKYKIVRLKPYKPGIYKSSLLSK